MNSSQGKESCFYRPELSDSWVPTDRVCPQERVVVAVMAEPKGDMLVRVIHHVM